MATKPIRVSIDSELPRRIDLDPETRERGRSALIRSAVELYLAGKQRADVEAGLATGYGGQAAKLELEIANLIERQVWPAD